MAARLMNNPGQGIAGDPVTEPVGTVSLVTEHGFSRWQSIDNQRRALVVAYLVGPGRRTPRAAWSSSRLWCARYVGEQTLFVMARSRSMRLQMRRIDHQLVGIASLGR